MSHSDSEVRDEEKERRRKLGAITKAKFRCRIDSNPILKTRELKLHLKPILAELKLIRCVNNNNVEETKNLLESGVSANSTDSMKRSALHIAVSRGYREVVELLVKHGADPNKRDSIQNTPLHLAACSHNLAIITLLIKAGADVDSQDMHGRHPLQLAKSKLQILQRNWQQGHIEMTKLRAEVKDVIDLMISVQNAKNKGNSDFVPINPTEEMKWRISNLEIMKLTLNGNSGIDCKVDELLTSLQNFQIS
ncbi:ankyrin repeat domain-containing protein 54-like [Coccinella septempunctata]|uniref:ankyrin repeat domain-containing protein 54-like n=1 Tax=Coccinella septempunctata TaxID=41139 RepID=UPI001D06472F|nr:ankyrin repeat domain-containing protein 54-like [Coccinella septempunctata]